MTILKTALIFILVGFATNNAFAQVRFDLGLKGGLNFANINTSSSIAWKTDGRNSYHLGAYAMLKVAKFAIQPEVIFSRQGQNFTTSTLIGLENLENSLDYVNVPINIKFYLFKGINLQGGPQFGFLSSAKGDLINGSTNAVTKGQDISGYVEKFDVSLGLGAGWDLPLGFNFTVRYYVGLSDINRYTNNSTVIPNNLVSSMYISTAKNQVFQFSLGYRLFKIEK